MNLLIVGLGSMGKRRARLINSLGAGHTLCGVDTAELRRVEAGEMGMKAYASIPEALAAEKLDAAFVCTAPLTHAIIIGELLENDLPVFTELNLVADGYEELIEKATQKRLSLFLSSTMLYRAETQYIANAVRDFGKPVNYVYHVGQYLPDWHPWENYKDFFVGEARTGGVREILGIELPWLVDTFGPVTNVHVEKDKVSDLELPYADSWFITLRHKSGVKGFLAADVVSPKAVRRFEVFGGGLHLFWEGNPNTLYRFDCEGQKIQQVAAYRDEVQHQPGYSDNIVENAYVDEIKNFFAVLEGKEEPKWTFEEDLNVIRLMEAMETGGKDAT
jgi:predicted dehydrogenase